MVPWPVSPATTSTTSRSAGVLAHIGRRDAPPTPPLNLVADFGGGGMLLAFGVVCALFETARSGHGQVIDAAMIDGAALLMAMMWGYKALDRWRDERGTNIYDSGAPDYDVYETKDGQYVSIGAREPKFFAELLDRLGLDAATLPVQADREGWDDLRRAIAGAISTRSRDEWEKELESRDVCVAPVLRMEEAARHPHITSRQTIVERDGVLQPAPAPRSRARLPRLPVRCRNPEQTPTPCWRTGGSRQRRSASGATLVRCGRRASRRERGSEAGLDHHRISVHGSDPGGAAAGVRRGHRQRRIPAESGRCARAALGDRRSSRRGGRRWRPRGDGPPPPKGEAADPGTNRRGDRPRQPVSRDQPVGRVRHRVHDRRWDGRRCRRDRRDGVRDHGQRPLSAWRRADAVRRQEVGARHRDRP